METKLTNLAKMGEMHAAQTIKQSDLCTRSIQYPHFTAALCISLHSCWSMNNLTGDKVGVGNVAGGGQGKGWLFSFLDGSRASFVLMYREKQQ